AARELLAARQLFWSELGRCLLAGLKRLAHTLRASYGARDLLRDLQAEGLELRDVDELNADVRDRMQRRVQRVDRGDRRQGDGGERCSGLLIGGGVVEGGPGTWRDRFPAVLLGDQVVVGLRGGPGHVLPRVGLVGDALRDAERPSP